MNFLLSPYGRVSRRGFWLGYVGLFAALLAGAYFADGALAKGGGLVLPAWLEPFQWALDFVGGPFTLAIIVLAPWVTAMMVLKRLHDRGFGGLMLIWKIIAFVVLAWLALNAHTLVPGNRGMAIEIIAALAALLMALRLAVIVLCLGGWEGENRFGPDPLERGRSGSNKS